MTFGDKVILGLISLGVIASFVFSYSRTFEEPEMVVVHLDGRPVYRASLKTPMVHVLNGSSGPLTMEIRDMKVAIVEANCPNQVCVRMGWRSRAGDVIVCVPNKIMIRIVGTESQEVRAVTG